MNERIRELAIEAGDDWEHTLKEDREFLEKFAKLIVRDCAKTIESQDVDPSFKNRMSWAIKTKFGIES